MERTADRRRSPATLAAPTHMDENTSEQVRCPICGGPAERGCVYGERGPLRWVAGPVTWEKNLASLLGAGDSVGEEGVFTAPHAEGVRCVLCHHIILRYDENG